MKISTLDRALLFVMVVLAAYQVAIGIDHLTTLSIAAFTIAFGILIIAGLVLIILGFDVMESPLVVIVSTIIPLAMSLGLVWERLISLRTIYLAFAIIGFLAVLITRSIPVSGKVPTVVLAIVHGVAGLTIVLLPVIFTIRGAARPAFLLVGVGGALIGIGGLLLSFLKAGKPILSREKIFRILPGLLLLMTACFVAGFEFG